jgi:hypothetical protein
MEFFPKTLRERGYIVHVPHPHMTPLQTHHTYVDPVATGLVFIKMVLLSTSNW